jgi:hypothetical protein
MALKDGTVAALLQPHCNRRVIYLLNQNGRSFVARLSDWFGAGGEGGYK